MSDNVVEATYNGKPLEALANLIEKRKKILSESTEDAVIATAITVLKSLRADTRIAPKTARPESYKITDTGYEGGWERVGGVFHRVVRASYHTHSPKIPGIYPVNLAGQHYTKGEIVKVYKIEPVNDETMQWEKTKNKGCWYVFAQSESVAERFAKQHMSQRIKSYRGLAKATLGFAMAAISTQGDFAKEVKTSKSRLAAQQAAQVLTSKGVDNYSITVNDLLRYSGGALTTGHTVQYALMKAANSIAGRLSKMAIAPLDMDVSTPFPEVTGKKG